MVYSRKVEEEVYTFGVSGRLYKSNVLLYDHQTESLWSQLQAKAISGAKVGKRLERIPSTRTNWATWKKMHPDTLVLSTKTGYHRDYARDPYTNYYRVATIWFPVGDVRKDLSPKEMVLGIEIGGEAKAYALEQLREKKGILKEIVGGVPIQIDINPEGEVIGVRNQDGKPIPHIFAYWFAWQAFHPETTVYKEKR